MFSWLMRLFIAGLAVLLIWNVGPHALDNYRAMELGIPGTVAVQACRGGCYGPFVSDNGQVRIDRVDLVSAGSSTQAVPGRSIAVRVAGPQSTGAHVERDWPSMVFLLVFGLLVLGLFMLLLTPGRPSRRFEFTPTDAALGSDLGAAAGGREWTAHRWLLIGAILLVAGLSPVFGYLTGGLSTDKTSTVDMVVGLTLGGALLLLGGLLVGRGIAGSGRRLYLFERGLIVSRRGRHTVYRYSDVVDARVSRSRVGDNGPTYPYAIRLTLTDGRHVTITDRASVPAIMEHLPRHE